MTIYSCRSRSSRSKALKLKFSSVRKVKISSKRTVQVPIKVPRRSFLFKKNLAKLPIYCFKPSFKKLTSRIQGAPTPSLTWKHETWQKTQLATPTTVRYKTKKLYRHFNVYQSRFRKGSKVKKIVLASRYNSSLINQNLSYIVFAKADFAKFGLMIKEDNSIEELLASLLLFFETNLQSGRINVVYYRYIKVKEKSGWFEICSFLINCLGYEADGDKFPSPKSFSI